MATMKAQARAAGGIQFDSDALTNPANTAAQEATVKTLGLSTAQWITIITAGSAAFLLFVYFGHGGTRGAVL